MRRDLGFARALATGHGAGSLGDHVRLQCQECLLLDVAARLGFAHQGVGACRRRPERQEGDRPQTMVHIPEVAWCEYEIRIAPGDLEPDRCLGRRVFIELATQVDAVAQCGATNTIGIGRRRGRSETVEVEFDTVERSQRNTDGFRDPGERLVAADRRPPDGDVGLGQPQALRRCFRGSGVTCLLALLVEREQDAALLLFRFECPHLLARGVQIDEVAPQAAAHAPGGNADIGGGGGLQLFELRGTSRAFAADVDGQAHHHAKTPGRRAVADLGVVLGTRIDGDGRPRARGLCFRHRHPGAGAGDLYVGMEEHRHHGELREAPARGRPSVGGDTLRPAIGMQALVGQGAIDECLRGHLWLQRLRPISLRTATGRHREQQHGTAAGDRPTHRISKHPGRGQRDRARAANDYFGL